MWRWVEHTGELELEIEVERAEEVFSAATAAVRDLLGDEAARTAPPAVRMLTVEAPDRPALLAAFVEELVFLVESESLVPFALRGIELRDRAVRADVALVPGEPRHLVKAVTYHRLEFERAGAGYRARVVLDV